MSGSSNPFFFFFLLTVKTFYSSFSKFFNLLQKQATCEKVRSHLIELYPEEIMAETNRAENIFKPQCYWSDHLYFKNKVFEAPAEGNFHCDTWLAMKQNVR